MAIFSKPGDDHDDDHEKLLRYDQRKTLSFISSQNPVKAEDGDSFEYS